MFGRIGRIIRPAAVAAVAAAAASQKSSKIPRSASMVQPNKHSCVPMNAQADEVVRTQVLGNSEASSSSKWKKVTLKDGRTKVVLGGLENDVKAHQKKVLRAVSVSVALAADLIETQKSLLEAIQTELRLLQFNPELETDEFVSLEIAKITELSTIMKKLEKSLETPHGDLIAKNTSALKDLEGQYTERSDIVRVYVDDNKNNLNTIVQGIESKKLEIQSKKFVVSEGGDELSYEDFRAHITKQNFIDSFSEMKRNGSLKRFRNSKKEVYQVRDKDKQVLGYVKPIGERDTDVERLGADTAILVSNLAKKLGFGFVADAFEHDGHLFSSVVAGQDFPSDYFSNTAIFEKISQDSINEVMLLQALLRPYDDHPGNFKYSTQPDGQLKIVGNFDTEERSYGSNKLRLRAKNADPDFNNPDDFYAQGVTRNFFPMFKQADTKLGETFKVKVLSMTLSSSMPSAVRNRLDSIKSGIEDKTVTTPNDMIALGDPITFSASKIIRDVGGDAYSYLVGEVDFEELSQVAQHEYDKQLSEKKLSKIDYNSKISALKEFEETFVSEKNRMLQHGLKEPLAYSDSPGPHWWHKNLYTRYISHQEFFNTVESLANRFIDSEYKDEGNHFEKSVRLGNEIERKNLDNKELRQSLATELTASPPGTLSKAPPEIQALMRHHIISFILGESCKE